MDKIKQVIFDEDHLILQTGDGGDCAANMGTYHIFIETLSRMQKSFDYERFKHNKKLDFVKACTKLEGLPFGKGLYRRYNDSNFWGSRPDTMSRDQTIPLLGAWALYGMKDKAWEYFLGHLKRGLLFAGNTTPNWTYPPDHRLATPAYDWTWWKKIRFFMGWRPTNNSGIRVKVYGKKLPDLTIAEFWALEIRALNWWLLWPLLVIFDCLTVLGSLDKVYRYAKDEGNSDDRNHINILLTGLQVLWTPTMGLAGWIYAKRPKARAVAHLDGEYYFNRNGPQTSLDHYYRQWNAPPLNELAEPIMEKYF